MAKQNYPKLSIIIPVFNRPNLLDKCLVSIYKQNYKNFEVCIIDDCSTADLKSIADKFSARYFYLEKNKGPAFARNFGAKNAKGEILVFIDSDVLMTQGFLRKVDHLFNINKEISAIQGNYTSIPYYKNFFSFFKNLTLHFNFRRSTSRKYTYSIATFCTAIKREVFLKSKRFDQKIKTASIEDDEYGVKLIKRGHKIFYENTLQVKHMKRFNFYSLIKQDFKTGFTKIKSLLRKKSLFNSKELTGSHANLPLLFSIPLSTLIILGTIFFFMIPSSITILFLIILLEIFILINLGYFRFIVKTKSVFFLIYTFLTSIVDNFVIQLGIFFGFLDYLIGNKY